MPASGLVILAAGASSRMGAPKQLLPYGERNLLSHTVEAAVDSECTAVVLVLGANHDSIKKELASHAIQTVENKKWMDGLSSSIRLGITALMQSTSDVEAAVICTCDQPLLTAEIINRLVSEFESTGAPIVAAQYAGTLGVPALFCRDLFDELLSLSGDRGAKSIILKHSADVVAVDFPQGAIDIDTPEDYNALLDRRA